MDAASFPYLIEKFSKINPKSNLFIKIKAQVKKMSKLVALPLMSQKYT